MNAQFPTDNRLRDDIGLPPLAESRPPLSLLPRMAAESNYFPTDDRLRDDIGLLPIVHSAAAATPPSPSLAARAAHRCVAAVRAAAAALMLVANRRSLGYGRGARPSTARQV
jgi:hypothetical protein